MCSIVIKCEFQIIHKFAFSQWNQTNGCQGYAISIFDCWLVVRSVSRDSSADLLFVILILNFCLPESNAAKIFGSSTSIHLCIVIFWSYLQFVSSEVFIYLFIFFATELLLQSQKSFVLRWMMFGC